KVQGDQVVTVAPANLQLGDVVIFRPGGRIPADGTVVDGTADVDESMITGESRPVRREVGAHVVAGTVATDNALQVKVDAVGDDTALAGPAARRRGSVLHHPCPASRRPCRRLAVLVRPG